jgi:hypothetical protein
VPVARLTEIDIAGAENELLVRQREITTAWDVVAASGVERLPWSRGS